MDTGSNDGWAFQSSTWLCPQAAEQNAPLMWTPSSKTGDGCGQPWRMLKCQTKKGLLVIVMIFIERRQLRGRMEGDGQKLRSLGAKHLPPPSSSEGQGKSNTHWLRSKLVVGKEKSGPYPGGVQILVNSFLSPTPPLPSPTPPHPINHQVQFYVLNITGLPRALTSAQVSTFLPRPSHQSPLWSFGLWSCPL